MKIRWRIGIFALVATLASATFGQSPDTQLRYRVYYQCNGERVLVDHCRKDDDGMGYGPPTKPQENYCLVYYPDQPKRGGFTVQKAELYDDIVKKLQACGALAASQTKGTSSSGSTSKAYYDEGSKYYQAKDYSKAIPYFREAVRLRPNDADSWTMLGTSYYLLQQYQDALISFQECARLSPNNPDVLFMLGAGYARVGNKEAALEVYRKLQSMDQKQAQNLDLVINKVFATPATGSTPAAGAPASSVAQQVRAYFDAKDYPKTIEAAKKALATNPNDAEVLNLLGLSYSASKRYTEAETALQQAIRLQPKEAWYPYNLGEAYFFSRDFAKAIPAYQSALTVKPDAKFAADAYHWIGLSHESLKQFDEAAKAYQRSLEIKPGDPDVFYDLGLAYLDGKHYLEAETAFSQALRAKPDRALCNYFIGYIYNEREEFAKAVPYLQAELRLNPKHTLSHRELGYAYLQMRKDPEAVSELKLVLQADPKDAIAQQLLGEAYVEMENISGAKQVQQALLSLDKDKAADLEELIAAHEFLKSRPPASGSVSSPTPAAATASSSAQPGAATPLARQYIVLGSVTAMQDPGKALGYYQRAIALHPDKDTLAMAYAYEASAYDNLKQYDKAVAAYGEALKLNPEDNHTRYLLGWLYAERGNKDEAMKIYQALLPTDKAEADHLYLKIQSAK